MVEIEKDLWQSSGPTFLPKQSHLQQDPQDHIQAAFEAVQGGSLHNLCGQPVPVLHYPHSKDVLLGVQEEHSVFQFVPTGSCPGTKHQ